jgi:hypothetical protein
MGCGAVVHGMHGMPRRMVCSPLLTSGQGATQFSELSAALLAVLVSPWIHPHAMMTCQHGWCLSVLCCPHHTSQLLCS